MSIPKTASQKKIKSRAKTPKAEGIHRKRTIEKTFSQHDDDDTESEKEIADEKVQLKKQCLTDRT